MESIVKQSFDINLIVLGAFGLYAPAISTRSYKLRGYVLLLLLTLPIPILGTIYFLLERESEQMDYNFIVIAELGAQMAKMLPFIINAERTRRCINYFETPFLTTLERNQTEIISRCVRICRMMSRIFLLSVVGSNIFFATKPVFGSEYMLPVDVWLPYNPKGGLTMYYFTYVFLVLGTVYTSISGAAIDTLIAGLACLTAGQLEVLKDNLQYLSEYADDEISKNSENRSKTNIVRDKIKKCIDHHNVILCFVKEYQQCFSSSAFNQFAGSIIAICFVLLQMSKAEPFSFNFFLAISIITTLLLEIYLYCYYGTILFEESNTLTNAIYMSKWYECDLKSRKDLIILMERAKRPITVTAGKVLDLSVATFTTILRRSYSLLAVMKNR